MNKEEIYDEKISPLVAQIIDICKTNNIAMLVSFHIYGENPDPDLKCLTVSLLSDEPERMKVAFDTLWKISGQIVMVTIKSEGGEICD